MAGNERQSTSDVPRRDLRLSDVMRQGHRKTMSELSVAYPCEIVAFDSTTQLATVKCDFSHVHRDDAGEQVLPPEVVPNVMVAFEGVDDLSFQNGGHLTFPVFAGHKGWVTVFDRSVERWIETGDGGDPGVRHAHQRIDGVLKLGIRSRSQAIENFDSSAAVLEYQQIKIGKDASSFAARVGDDTTAGVTMATWISAVTTVVNAIAGPGTAIPPTDFGSISSGSSKVRIE